MSPKVTFIYSALTFCITSICFTNSVFAAPNKRDVLARTQQTLSRSLAAQDVRTRVAAENMANAESPGYIPKEVHLGSKHDRKTNATDVHVKNIAQNRDKVKKVYNPNHPKADETGNVTMPDTDPLINYMDLQKARIDAKHIQKSYQLTTEMRHSTLKMMNQ